jgi:hypothetical protein
MTTLVAVTLSCTLNRSAGSPIACETTDLGPTGMRLTTERPLAVDETLSFDVPLGGEAHICGQARVVSEERPGVYALRFSRLSEAMAEAVAKLAKQG